MTHVLKHTLGLSLGLGFLAFMPYVAQAGTAPCVSCGSGSRPTTGAGSTPPATFVFPVPGAGTGGFTYTPAPFPTPAPTPPTVRPTLNPATFTRLQVARPR